jgi:hypothetical protein
VSQTKYVQKCNLLCIKQFSILSSFIKNCESKIRNIINTVTICFHSNTCITFNYIHRAADLVVIHTYLLKILVYFQLASSAYKQPEPEFIDISKTQIRYLQRLGSVGIQRALRNRD